MDLFFKVVHWCNVNICLESNLLVTLHLTIVISSANVEIAFSISGVIH